MGDGTDRRTAYIGFETLNDHNVELLKYSALNKSDM
jgi:hypothetical protein